MDEMSDAEFQHVYDELMQIAAENGLCCNCFHTLDCCNGNCPDPATWWEAHLCAGPEELLPDGT